MHLNRAKATSLLMLISEFNMVKKFTKLKCCERFGCTYCVEPSLCLDNTLMKAAVTGKGGACGDIWRTKLMALVRVHMGGKRIKHRAHERTCICCMLNANE